MAEVIRELPVRLDHDELLERAKESAALSMKIQGLERERAAVNERMKPLKARVAELVTVIASGEESRKVACREVFAWDQGLCELVREDTGEVVEVRGIRSHERQQELALDVAEPAKELADKVRAIAVRRGVCDNEECESRGTVCTYLECDTFVPVGTEPAEVESEGADESTVEPAAALAAPKCMGMTFRELLPFGYSRNEAKLLAAGLRLVRLDREQRRIDTVPLDPCRGWQPDSDPRGTFAAAERDLARCVETEELFVQVSAEGDVLGHRGRARVTARGFRFYRAEGLQDLHARFRIKVEPNWSTWQSFDSQEELQAAWSELLDNDPWALEG